MPLLDESTKINDSMTFENLKIQTLLNMSQENTKLLCSLRLTVLKFTYCVVN